MGWIGIADHTQGQLMSEGATGPHARTGCMADPQRLLERGTILLETRLSPEGRPQTLLEFRRNHPMFGYFSLQALPSGGIILVDTLGDDLRHVTLPHEPDGRTDVMRLTYSWDTATGWGRLTLERPETDLVHSVTLNAPHPMPLADIHSMIIDPSLRRLDLGVDFIAVSSVIEPVGPMPGLTGRLPVSTPRGYVAADRLQRGDLVDTDNGTSVPVLQVVQRTVPARGSFRPVLLRAPYFGLGRDIVVAPQQRLIISGSEVEYMFGREAVLVPARHLVNGISTRYADCPDLITYHHLLLPGHEAIVAAGCPVESLYVGRLRRKPEQLGASILAGVSRSTLPEHPKPIWPVLKPFEAITLAMNRAA